MQPVNYDEPDEEISSLISAKAENNTGSLFQRSYRYYLFNDQEGLPGEPEKEADFLKDVIEMVISPIHKNYQRQMNRLSAKEKQQGSGPTNALEHQMPVNPPKPPTYVGNTSFENSSKPNSNAYMWHLDPDEYKNNFPGLLSAPLAQLEPTTSPLASPRKSPRGQHQNQNKRYPNPNDHQQPRAPPQGPPHQQPHMMPQHIPRHYQGYPLYNGNQMHYQQKQSVGADPTYRYPPEPHPGYGHYEHEQIQQLNSSGPVYPGYEQYDIPPLPLNANAPVYQYEDPRQKQYPKFVAPAIPQPIPQIPSIPQPQPAPQAAPEGPLTPRQAQQQDLQGQLQLSPASKQEYQQFLKLFKEKEKAGGLELALQFVERNLKMLPEKMHWKIFLEVADLAKREKCFDKAKKYYELVNFKQPYAGKGWLEFAKMEEESGNLDACTKILQMGLYYCPQHEGLLVKGIKHNEKMGTLNEARALLARLKNVAIDRSWRTIMEGGMLEARQGNIQIARQIFKYLMEKVPLYGPIYTEAIRLEIKMEDYKRGMYLVEKGLERIPSYGPLVRYFTQPFGFDSQFFSALKLEERVNGDYKKRVQTALPRLSKELVWKIWFELAQIQERKGNRAECYDAYVKAVISCPKNLLWKVWLGGARTEIQNKNYDTAEQLLMKADADVPTKMRATVLVDLARYQEYCHNLDESRKILEQAKIDSAHEWKVFLEAILLEIRANNLNRALTQVQQALKIHASTGRLWAILIQLTHLIHLGSNQIDNETSVFLEAMTTVPKSGEVWCEGARLALHQNLLEHARRYLAFAVQFTPQYGDSFVEYLRIELLMLMNSLKPGETMEEMTEQEPYKEAIHKIELLCVNAEPTYGVCWAYCRDGDLDSSRRCFNNAKTQLLKMASVAQEIKKGNTVHQGQQLTNTQQIIYSNLDIAAYFLGLGLNSSSRTDEFRFKTIFH